MRVALIFAALMLALFLAVRLAIAYVIQPSD